MFDQFENIKRELGASGHDMSNNILDIRSEYLASMQDSFVENNTVQSIPTTKVENKLIQQATSVIKKAKTIFPEGVFIKKKEGVENNQKISFKFPEGGIRGIWRKFKETYPIIGHFFDGVKFVGMTLVIFAIFFVGSNFDAYNQRFQFWYHENLNPAGARENQQQFEKNLEDSKTQPIFETRVIEKGELPQITMNVKPSPNDFRIVLPKLGVNVPVKESDLARQYLEDQKWKELEAEIQNQLKGGVVHYPLTSYPGDPGNVFVTGHSSYYSWDNGRYKNVFSLLDKLVIGDEIILFYEGEEYRYTIHDAVVVEPTKTEVLSQDYTQFELTLMTCWPVGTAKDRLIIKAHLTSPEPDLSKIPKEIQQQALGDMLVL